MAKKELTEAEKEEARNAALRKNVMALGVTVDFQKKQIEDLQVQLKALINNIGTLALQFERFQEQRVIELQTRVNGGPTA